MSGQSGQLPDWPRPFYSEGGDAPFLLYVVYGCEPGQRPLSASRYRCDGIPSGLQLESHGPEQHPDVVDHFRNGYLWDELQSRDPLLADKVAAQSGCVMLKGEVADDSSLNYLRNGIGLITWLLDCGGVAVFDPQAFRWWSPDEWRSSIFEPSEALPRHHAIILVSDEDGATQWWHTRGMRKFGRPDISIHGVRPTDRDAIDDVLNRFIEHQAFGGLIAEGQEIQMNSLPSGMRCRHRGSIDDPDFNNVHVEITWP